jgi:hypothetical protein
MWRAGDRGAMGFAKVPGVPFESNRHQYHIEPPPEVSFVGIQRLNAMQMPLKKVYMKGASVPHTHRLLYLVRIASRLHLYSIHYYFIHPNLF